MAIFLADLTINANTLTNNGGSEVTAGLPFADSKVAVDLESSETDYLYAADSSSLDITGAFTLACWVNFESLPGNNAQYFIISKFRDDTANRSYSLILFNVGGTLRLQCIISPDGNYDVANDLRVNWTPTTGTWYHVAVSFAVAPVVKFYVNGSQQGADQVPTATAIHSGTSRFNIGAYNTETTPVALFDGVIDDVRIYNTVVSDFTNRSQRLNGNESGLVAYWPFESTVGGSFIFNLL